MHGNGARLSVWQLLACTAIKNGSYCIKDIAFGKYSVFTDSNLKSVLILYSDRIVSRENGGTKKKNFIFLAKCILEFYPLVEWQVILIIFKYPVFICFIE